MNSRPVCFSLNPGAASNLVPIQMLPRKQFAEIKTRTQVEECKAPPERDYSWRGFLPRSRTPTWWGSGTTRAWRSSGGKALDEEGEQLCGDSAAVTPFLSPRPPLQAAFCERALCNAFTQDKCRFLLPTFPNICCSLSLSRTTRQLGFFTPQNG